MVLVGQQMHDSFAEALDDVVVCVMTTGDVRRLLPGDTTKILGERADQGLITLGRRRITVLDQ